MRAARFAQATPEKFASSGRRVSERRQFRGDLATTPLNQEMGPGRRACTANVPAWQCHTRPAGTASCFNPDRSALAARFGL